MPNYELGEIRTDRGQFLDKGNMGVDPRCRDFGSQGARGDGTANDRQAISDADTFAQTDGCSLVFGPGTYLVSSNLTITSGCKFARGAKLKPASGVTLTLNGVVDAGLFQVFDISAGGTIALGQGSARHLLPEWWGAVGDNSTTCTTAIQAALTAAAATGAPKKVKLGAGTYRTGNLVIAEDGIILEGECSGFAYTSVGPASTKLKAIVGATVLVDLAPLADGTDPAYCQIRDIEIDGSLIATVGVRVSTHNMLERVVVRNTLTYGIHLTNWTNGTVVRNCSAISNFTVGLGVTGSSTTVYRIEGGVYSLNNTNGLNLTAGFGAYVSATVESNGDAGLRLYKPGPAESFSMGHILFENLWLEDNHTTAGGFDETLSIDAENRSEANAINNLRFVNCRFSCSEENTRRFMLLACVKDSRFENCSFSGTTYFNAITTGVNTYRVGFIDNSFDALTAPDSQMREAVAAGVRVFFSDRVTRFEPTLTNSWVDQGAGFPEPRFWFDERGDVRLHGNMKDGTVGNSAFTLPAGFRPTTARRFAVVSNGALGVLEVQVDGDVVPISGNNASFNLDGVCFPTD